MKPATIVILLILLVVGVFAAYPNLLGEGNKTSFSIASEPIAPAASNSQTLVSDVSCTAVIQCTDYAEEQGGNGQYTAECKAGKCVFTFAKIWAGGVQ